MKTFFSMLVVIAAAAGATYYLKYRPAEQAIHFRTAPVKRGDLAITVSATGTVEPEEVVDIGAQVVGRIKDFGPDPLKQVDYNSEVDEGTILARIDDSIYKAQRNQAKALLDRSVADLAQLEARRVQTEAEWIRAQKLRSLTVSSTTAAGASESRAAMVPVRAISDADFILARSNFQVAAANVEVGKAVVEQQNSALSLAQTNCDYTVIKSPAKGTIISRRVNVGQTVVSSLNAPSLFLIAKDLRRMQVRASVNEADIGGLKVGTPVQFTVDAYPKDVFHGEVKQVRLNASMTQNVVTYPVIITADNSNLKLLPYLTADVKFEVAKRKNIWLVPNSALRYRPRPELRETASAEAGEDAPSEPAAAVAQRGTGEGEREDGGTVWIRRGEQVYPLDVEVGVTDGTQTEVASDQLNDQMEVVLGETDAATAAADQVNNPFAPKMPGGRRSGRM